MNRFISWLCKTCFKYPVDKFLIKEVRGKHNIPSRNFILATNHQSHLDQIITGYVCVPRPYTYLGQTDRYSGFTKIFLYLLYFVAGVIHVNRKIKESRKRAAQEAINALKEGVSLVIYPEGTRTRTGKIQDGKTGVAKIFLKTGVPILPVGITGSFELMPPGRAFPKFERKIKINIGKPLFFNKELQESKNLKETSKEYKEILKNITDKVMSEIQRLVKEIKLASFS
jgi:1-acyl-sn-glycerol-3-phosphate acyltransferase